MAMAIYHDASWNGLRLVAESLEENGRLEENGDQQARILTALGLPRGELPRVDDENLLRYYRFLSQNLSFPFEAHYPEPANSIEEALYECTVLELLDPKKYVRDEFSGIFCKTHKGRFEVNLPLVELEVLPQNANFQLIEDYWYWFWNWR